MTSLHACTHATPLNPIAQLLAAAAVVLRAARWVNDAVAGMAALPRAAQSSTQHQHQRQPRPPQSQSQPRRPDGEREAETETPTRRGGGGGSSGARSRGWGARESVLLNARGTRMPPAVVASLSEAELEVRILRVGGRAATSC